MPVRRSGSASLRRSGELARLGDETRNQRAGRIAGRRCKIHSADAQFVVLTAAAVILVSAEEEHARYLGERSLGCKRETYNNACAMRCVSHNIFEHPLQFRFGVDVPCTQTETKARAVEIVLLLLSKGQVGLQPKEGTVRE